MRNCDETKRVVSIDSLSRRGFLATSGSGAVAVLAGCTSSGGDGVSASLDADSSDREDHLSETFAASEGDEFEITIEAGENGADVSLMPEEGQTGMSGDDPIDEGADDIGFPWFLDPDEEVTETVEIRRDGDHLFWITAGQAEVSAERA